LIIRVEKDVGGHGKLNIIGNNRSASVLWRYLSGRLQLSQHISL